MDITPFEALLVLFAAECRLGKDIEEGQLINGSLSQILIDAIFEEADKVLTVWLMVQLILANLGFIQQKHICPACVSTLPPIFLKLISFSLYFGVLLRTEIILGCTDVHFRY